MPTLSASRRAWLVVVSLLAMQVIFLIEMKPHPVATVSAPSVGGLATPNEVFRITACDGEAMIQSTATRRAGSGRKITRGTIWRVGETLMTAADARVAVILADQGEMIVGPSSTVSALRRAGAVEIDLEVEKGAALFSWNGDRHPSVMRVHTPNVICLPDTAAPSEFFVVVDEP